MALKSNGSSMQNEKCRMEEILLHHPKNVGRGDFQRMRNRKPKSVCIEEAFYFNDGCGIEGEEEVK
ncbi:MAG: hypothetical protein NT007_17850 [Candidatus Kapabacteria bacterium]|nr:hypothetical protein [Candidatus Kapabacteria bacterium]